MKVNGKFEVSSSRIVTGDDNNVIIGKQTGSNNTSGENDIFIGYRAGYKNTQSKSNIFIGYQSGLNYNDKSSDGNGRGGNVFVGDYTGTAKDGASGTTTGRRNSFFGYYAGWSFEQGSNNIFIGAGAGENFTVGSGNIFIGNEAGMNATGDNKLYIANSRTTTPLIYGEFDNQLLKINGYLSAKTLSAEVSSGIALKAKSPATTSCWAAYFDGDVKVTSYLYGTLYSGSDARLKKDVQTISGALNKVLKLRGVSYYWKNKEELGTDSTMFNFDNKRHIGVIAQELEKEFPELVSDDKEGIKTVEYSGLAPILIEAIKELKAEKDDLQKQVDELRKMVEVLMKDK